MAKQTRKISEGKLPLDVLTPILRSLPRGGLARTINRVGMDAAVVRSTGKSIVFVTGSTIGTRRNLASELVMELSKAMREFGAKPSIIDPILLFPKGASIRVVKMVISEIKAASSLCRLTIAKGHTEVTTSLDRPTIIVTIIGSTQRRPKW
jgi:hydrogenase maturation factor